MASEQGIKLTGNGGRSTVHQITSHCLIHGLCHTSSKKTRPGSVELKGSERQKEKKRKQQHEKLHS